MQHTHAYARIENILEDQLSTVSPYVSLSPVVQLIAVMLMTQDSPRRMNCFKEM
jgi:hypothetical protein